MARFTGTSKSDTIAPGAVSAGVDTDDPAFPAPSGADDTILGGRGRDLIRADGGDDQVVGGRGDDSIALGAGDDTAIWNAGDGSDLLEGGAGFDTLEFRGSDAGEQFDIASFTTGATLFRDRGFVRLETEAVERLELHTGGGSDDVAISDLTGSGVEEVLVAFEPDGGFDAIAFIGTGSAEGMTLTNTPGGGILVEGLGVSTEITGYDEAHGEFIISLGEGNDTVDAAGLTGADLIVATGTGDDLGLLGAGDDHWAAVGATGNDTVDGGAGQDTFDLDASIADDVIVVAGTGAAATATIGGFTTTLSDMERVELEGASGNDRLDGSGVTAGLRLFLFGGFGSDTLLGGARGDVLDGDAGDDSLTGGGGGDRFVFGAEDTAQQQDLDVITDFDAAEGDVLDLRPAHGAYTAVVVAEGVLVTLTAPDGDGDQVLVLGLTAVSDLAVLG